MILADTHALIWWITGDDRLSRRAREVMNHDSIGVAMITCWAVALLAARNRIEIHGRVVEWWHDVMALPSTALLPLTIEIAATAATLPDPIRDPADRLIVATALHHGVPLVTKDSRIHHSGLVQTIW